MRRISLFIYCLIISFIIPCIMSCESDDEIKQDNKEVVENKYDNYYYKKYPMGSVIKHYVKYDNTLTLIRFSPDDHDIVMKSIENKGFKITKGANCLNSFITYIHGMNIHGYELAVINASCEEAYNLSGVYYAAPSVLLSEDDYKELHFPTGVIVTTNADAEESGNFDCFVEEYVNHPMGGNPSILPFGHKLIKGDVYNICIEMVEKKGVEAAYPQTISLVDIIKQGELFGAEKKWKDDSNN